MYYLNGKEYNGDFESKGFFYGYACFETIMIKDSKLVFYNEHIERLKKSLEKLKIKTEFDFLSLKKEIELKSLKDGCLKILISDKDIFYTYKNISHRYFENGIKSRFIENYYQNEMGYLKSANYLGNILAREDLLKDGYFEGVFFNRNENICEGTISNLFFIKDNIIKTPSLKLNILPGIIREKVMDIIKKSGFEFEEGIYSKKDLLNADSIFFTNSLMSKSLVWVNEFQSIEKTKCEMISQIEKEYLKMLKNVI